MSTGKRRNYQPDLRPTVTPARYSNGGYDHVTVVYLDEQGNRQQTMAWRLAARGVWRRKLVHDLASASEARGEPLHLSAAEAQRLAECLLDRGSDQ